MTKDQFLATVLDLNNQSIEVFTDLVNKIESKSSSVVAENGLITISKSTIGDLVRELVEELTNLGADAVDDYQLEMNYNEVNLTDISLSSYKVESLVESVLERYFNEVD